MKRKTRYFIVYYYSVYTNNNVPCSLMFSTNEVFFSLKYIEETAIKRDSDILRIVVSGFNEITKTEFEFLIK